jgi:hypothetical protein
MALAPELQRLLLGFSSSSPEGSTPFDRCQGATYGFDDRLKSFRGVNHCASLQGRSDHDNLSFSHPKLRQSYRAESGRLDRNPFASRDSDGDRLEFQRSKYSNGGGIPNGAVVVFQWVSLVVFAALVFLSIRRFENLWVRLLIAVLSTLAAAVAMILGWLSYVVGNGIDTV